MTNHQAFPERRASILICVLVCLAVAAAMATAVTRSALEGHKALRNQRLVRQTELLLEAGIQRSAQQLAAREDYPGETWDLDASSIPGCTLAQIKITVSSIDGQWPRRIDVTARLSTGGVQVIQRSHSYPLENLDLLEEE